MPIFERLLVAYPRGVDLILDYADSMKVSRKFALAHALVQRARAIEPQNQRALRLEAQVHMERKSYAKAVPILRETIATHGPDAGLEADLGYALELSGDWEEAVDAYDRSLTLQPTNVEIAQSRRRLSDLIENALGGFVEYRHVADDRTLDLEGSFALKLDRDRTTLFGGLGFSSLSGRAQAVDNGQTDVDTDYVSLRAAISHRHGRANRIGGAASTRIPA